jgi:squalene-associated FAD-dependent desaturase
MATGGQWTLRPTASLFPFWLFDAKRRVPGTRPSDYLEAIRLARADDNATVAQCVDVAGPLYERLWQPLCRAALNTDAAEASARLLWRVIAMTLVKGERGCRPLLFSAGLSPTLVNPALELLKRHDCEIRFQSRARGIRWHDDRAIALHFPEGLLALELDDAVVLAVPPEICVELWPAIQVPDEYRTIVNVHYRIGEAVDLPGGSGLVGLIGATAQWLFVRGDVLSVTISAADEIAVQPNWEIANRLWAEVARVLGRNMGRVPAWRVIKERRATIAQTPAQIARRPHGETGLKNLFIAGDWTDTGLPATIEGSVQSGFEAARLALRAVRNLGLEE